MRLAAWTARALAQGLELDREDHGDLLSFVVNLENSRVGMTGIEPAPFCSPSRRPAIGPHPDEEARCRWAARLLLVCVERSTWAPLVSREIGCQRTVVRSPDKGRPERDRTSDFLLRRQALFHLSYGPTPTFEDGCSSRAAAPPGRVSSSARARSHERRVSLHLVERAIHEINVFSGRPRHGQARSTHTYPTARPARDRRALHTYPFALPG